MAHKLSLNCQQLGVLGQINKVRAQFASHLQQHCLSWTACHLSVYLSGANLASYDFSTQANSVNWSLANLKNQFPNEEFYDDNTRKFFANLQAFETKIKEDAITNSKEWLGKPKMSMETVDALFTPVGLTKQSSCVGE